MHVPSIRAVCWETPAAVRKSETCVVSAANQQLVGAAHLRSGDLGLNAMATAGRSYLQSQSAIAEHGDKLWNQMLHMHAYWLILRDKA